MMVRFVLALLWAFWCLPAASAGPEKANVSLTFDKVPLQQLVLVVYDECGGGGLVFDPSLSKLDAPVTVKLPAQTCSQVKTFLVDLLSRYGVVIEKKGLFDVVKLGRAKDERDEWKEVIYRPKHRDAIELAEMAQIAVRQGSFAHQRKGVSVNVGSASATGVPESGSNGASISSKHVDKLLFVGPASEVAAVQSLLARLDVPSQQVEIRAGIYEFQTDRSEGSAVNALVKALGGKVSVNFGSSLGGDTVKLKLPSFEAALDLLDKDRRFRYVARPNMLAKDSEEVRFFAGEDVRVTGAVVLDRNGNPIQSRETLSAGVTLQLTPRIRNSSIDVSLYEAVSSFVVSDQGEPNILKRDIRSRLVMQPGYVYIVGGLKSTRATKEQSRFFSWRTGDSEVRNETEVLLLLSVDFADVEV